MKRFRHFAGIAISSFVWTALIWPSAADEIAREGAAFHLLFVVEDVVKPYRMPDDRLLLCTLKGQPATIFRGDRRVQSGVPISVDVPCWPSADRQPEPDGPTRYYYDDPVVPQSLILWADHDGERLVGRDWVSLD